jgi:hypothetical protein
MSDNFHFDLTGVPLDLSLKVATSNGQKVEAWRVDEEKNLLVLYWTPTKTSNPLPAPLEEDALEGFIRSWLTLREYGEKPDIDGSARKGWRVFNEAWGHVGGEWEAFMAVEPTWMLYAK